MNNNDDYRGEALAATYEEVKIVGKKSFNLKDYLLPGGKYPYARLTLDLEAALAAGHDVYLWNVAGHFMLSGSPNLVQYGRPWSNGNLWFKTAKDALDGRKGKK